MSEITVCIVTNNNYTQLNKTVFGIKRKFAAAKIHVIDATPIPNPLFFPDGVQQYIVAKPRLTEQIYKGLLLGSVRTSYMIFVSDSFVISKSLDITNLVNSMESMTRFKIMQAPEILKKCSIFNTFTHKNPNNVKDSGNHPNFNPNIYSVSIDSLPELNTRSRPTFRDKQLVKAVAVRKQRLISEYVEPTNKEKHKLVGLWLDLKTNFVYKINADGTSVFCNVPKINVKAHTWRKTVHGEIEIINSEHARFKLTMKNKNEIVIKRSGKAEFDFHHIGKNIPERLLIRQNLK